MRAKSVALFICVILFWPIALYAGSQTTSSTLASTIVDQARKFLGDSTTYGGTQQSIWSDAELLQYLNDGTMAIFKMGVVEDIESETLVDGQNVYPLGDPFIEIIGVVYNSTSPLDKGSFVGWQETEETGSPGYWFPWETGVLVYPAPDSTTEGNTIDVYVLERPVVVTATDYVLVPAQYDLALVYFIVAQAYGGRDGLIDRGAAFMQLFNYEMGQSTTAK